MRIVRIRRSTAWSLLLAAVIVAAYAYQAALFRHYLLDDAFITFRYSRSWAIGHGPYFNPGEHVEGYTNFLFMLLLTPAIYFGGAGAALPVAKMLGFFSGAVSLTFAFDTARRFAAEDDRLRPRAEIPGFLAAGLLAVNPTFALHAMSGLETTFYAGALMLGVWLDVSGCRRGRWRGAGLAFAAAALTRPEGILVLACYWSSAVLARRFAGADERVACPFPRVIDAVIPLLAIAAQLCFRAVYYDGELLPNTFFAKTGGLTSYNRFAYVGDGLRSGFFGVVGISLGAAGWYLRGGGRRLAAPCFVAGMTGVLLPLVTGSDWMLGWRLMQPFFPLLMCVVAVGWAKILLPRGRRLEAWAHPALLAFLLAFAALQQRDRRAFLTHVSTDAEEWPKSYGVLVRSLCEDSPGAQAIALMDIGKVGYSCFDRRILDITGLTDRYIAKSPGPFLQKDYDPGYIVRQHPQYVVIRLIERGDPGNPGKTIITPYTLIEVRIYNDPSFARLYRKERQDFSDSAPESDKLLAITGAERAIPHHGPDGSGYFLVFRRRELVRG